MRFVKEHAYFYKDETLSFKEKILNMSFSYLFFISVIVFIGLTALYSAANENFQPWAVRQFYRYAVSVGILFFLALLDIRLVMKYAYVFYGFVLGLLVAVDVAGKTGMGAQRWLDLKVVQIQPSELMKIALVLALARYFHKTGLNEAKTWRFLIPPVLMTAVPFLLIAVQPDLGTSLFLIFILVPLLFMVGVQIWKFCLFGTLGLASLPFVWLFLHDYQKARVLTFLSPESDPLGSGYHIMQSKIALGSGGLFGKGLGLGTQSHLNFLPEKQTDFIFTLIAEEFGMIGCLFLIALYIIVISYGFVFALRCTSFFTKVVALGLTINFSLYVFINIAMVIGLLPIVGVPLPLVSYGGTALMTLFLSFGLIECAYVNRDKTIGRTGSTEE
jgi:rod shape determining protein RodA